MVRALSKYQPPTWTPTSFDRSAGEEESSRTGDGRWSRDMRGSVTDTVIPRPTRLHNSREACVELRNLNSSFESFSAPMWPRLCVGTKLWLLVDGVHTNFYSKYSSYVEDSFRQCSHCSVLCSDLLRTWTNSCLSPVRPYFCTAVQLGLLKAGS